MLVAALGQNTANMAPVIHSGIPLANMEREEELPPQEGKDTKSKACSA